MGPRKAGEQPYLPCATFCLNSTNLGECRGLILVSHQQVSSAVPSGTPREGSAVTSSLTFVPVISIFFSR